MPAFVYAPVVIYLLAVIYALLRCHTFALSASFDALLLMLPLRRDAERVMRGYTIRYITRYAARDMLPYAICC